MFKYLKLKTRTEFGSIKYGYLLNTLMMCSLDTITVILVVNLNLEYYSG